MNDILHQKAAVRAAEQLRDLLLRFGADNADINITTGANSAQLTAKGSAGAASEFGDQRRPALRRLGRAIEALRRGEII
jgi:hypothetical protein